MRYGGDGFGLWGTIVMTNEVGEMASRCVMAYGTKEMSLSVSGLECGVAR